MAMDFKNLQFLSRGFRRHTVLLFSAKFRWNQKISWWVMAKKVIFKMAAAAILNFKKINFWLRGYSICYSVQNFIKIGLFFTEIWRFNDFRNGGRLSSWILKICRFRILALVDMLFCFLIQNIAEIGQSSMSWPKKRFSRWRPPPSWILKISIFGHVTVIGFNIWCCVPNLIKIRRF